MGLKEIQDKIKDKVNREYAQGFAHIRDERERKRGVMEKVLNTTLPQGQVRVNLLWRNIQLELALFLTDEIGVKFLSDNSIVGEELMNNANIVAKYDDVDMGLREMRETIVNHNALYGLSATVIDGWDKDSVQPLSDTLDPLSVIIDPFNYTGSKMRYFGVERRLSLDWIKDCGNFQFVDEIEEGFHSTELDKNKRSSDDANNLVTPTDNEGYVDIYDHFTVFDGKKWLTTWANDKSLLIRCVEISPLTAAEKKKPTKVKWPIQLHRRKPKFGSVMGVSIADEILQFQDAISILTNLQLIQANNLALGPDIFVDEKLGIDTEALAKRRPGGRIIPVENDSGMPASQGIYTQQIPAPSPFVEGMERKLEQRAEGTTNITQQSFGISPGGTQTKAEIQTLQQNANQILIWIANNYLQGQKEYWEAHYRSYVENIGNLKKRVSIFDNGKTIAREFGKEDFVDDGKVIAHITSKSQDAIENDKEYNKLVSLANFYLSNMKKGFPMDSFLRTLGKKANIREFDTLTFIPQSIDELNATKNLALLNANVEVPGPSDGEDFMTYVLIYRQALDTKAKFKALSAYEQAYVRLQKPEEDALAQEAMMMGRKTGGSGDSQSSAFAMNALSQTTGQNTGITKL